MYFNKKKIFNLSKIWYYEYECTYFNIDLFSAGYTKKFISL